ncbi:MAG TPA: VIT and VWA domain-containing protein, partial [Tepidisphaeraceae bacterium]|nr:VIT and VWA domain-containing protein [Tepidisphaeraceae bacterium]
TQVFRNTEDRIVEGLYTFPVPRNASVAGFSMWIGGKEMIGEVVEKQAAREIYNSYKAVNRDPGVLEQTDFRTFELRIFPIAPKAQQKVQVTYYQELDSDGEWTSYVYPLASNVRQTINSRVTKSFSMTVDVKSRLPIEEMRSPSHSRDLHATRYSPTYCQAVIGANSAALDRDVVIDYRLAKAQTGAALVASTPANTDGYFCLMLSAGDELKPAAVGMDYVFLLDVSGSMRDDDKIGQSRGTLGAFVNMLTDEDRFDCLAFNTASVSAFHDLAPADDVHKKSANDFLASRKAHGGTNLNAALAAAYRYAQPGRTLNVVVISDGLTEQAQVPMLQRMVNRRPIDSRILCVGVGNDVDRTLLQEMADGSGGLAAFVSADDDFARQAMALHCKLARPAITDINVSIAGIPVHDVEPPRMRNLFNGIPLRVYGRYGTAGPAQVTLTGKVDGKDWSQTFPVAFPLQADADPEIERMWAMRRIERLRNDPAGLSMSGVDQIVRLGEGYSIATEYTSFIVLENDAAYAKWKIAQRNAMRLTQDRDARAQLEEELKALRKKAPGGLGDPSAAPANADASGSMQPPPAATALTNPNPASPGLHLGGAMDPTYLLLVLGMSGLAVATWKCKGGSTVGSNN